MSVMLTLCSPAKVNLFLRVLGRREDGYHELATVLQAIDLMDTVSIKLGSAHACDRLYCSDPTVPTDSSNLALQAAELFRARSGQKFSLTINLDKHIPHQAGLGGGSANAATVLWGLNNLHSCMFSELDLMHLSRELGCDVPFFFSSGTALAEGIGERLTHLPPFFQGTSACIFKAEEGLSTPQVYGALNLDHCSDLTVRACWQRLRESGAHWGVNDLQKAAFQVRPELRKIYQTLCESGYAHVMLSGSGSAFYCLGNGTPPECPGLKMYETQFIHRLPGSWYEPLNAERRQATLTRAF